ncbi:MAG TPA: anti-sigma factor [Candidatus Acidoferrales bacterium]|jgi:anti-sigma-K factor RskA|nr:anti-sigma factor [Candidatus Acidoferrales bacterium]
MSDQPYHEMLDDVALYALGTLPAADAQRVRAHIESCAECRAEYAALAPAAALVGVTAETVGDLANCPGTLLKPRIMREIRKTAATPASAPARELRSPARVPVWPAYLVAAACIAIAIATSLYNVTLTTQLRDVQNKLAASTTRSSQLAGNLADERSTISEIMSADSKRFTGNLGEVIANGSKLYVAMHDLPAAPRGKVYQAWTLAKGAKDMAPSLTFVPDSRGVAIVALPVDARLTDTVAVSVEPEGGSKAPTSKPVLVVPLN